MKKNMLMLCVSLTAIMLAAGYSKSDSSGQYTSQSAGAEKSLNHQTLRLDDGVTASRTALPDSLLDSYYAGQESDAFEYFQHRSIQRFLAMWVKEATGDIDNPQWDLDSFTQIGILDHDFVVSRPDEPLYYCTFSDGADRYGYIIVKYDAAGPGIGNWGVVETSPYVYDLRANMEKISESLSKTDIDLSTAKASRVYLFDKNKNRADQIIRFTDGKGGNYICHLDDPAFEILNFPISPGGTV